jgi:ribosomal protein S12 methylthiotransferase accessory factor
VTEAVQCRLTEITGAREDILPDDFLRNRDDAELAAMAARVQGARPQRRLADRPPRYTPTFEGDLAVLCRALADAGITQAAVVDLSQADLGLPVVKAVVPELEGVFLSPNQPLRPRGQRLMQRWQAEQAKAQERS